MKRTLTAADILPLADYEKIRTEKRGAIIAEKKNRRLAVGPYATFYFENYDTMWLQVQEMLRIEKGGAVQVADEIRAYAPLVPQEHELTATMMLEIEDAARRTAVLATLGGIQDSIELRFGGEVVKAEAERDLDYTSAEGKASSVQFLHFKLTAQQVMKFRDPSVEAMVAITHANYGHMALMPQALLAVLRAEL